MRLLDSGLTRRQAIDLLLELVDSGVDGFHSSFEYESFPFFADVMTRVRTTSSRRDVGSIGKIGVPDFATIGSTRKSSRPPSSVPRLAFGTEAPRYRAVAPPIRP
jgi:hypothetical protein